MSKLSDNYPAMTYGESCDSVGIMGGCGGSCPVLQRDACPVQEEMEGVKEIWQGPELEVLEPVLFLIRIQNTNS